MTMPSKRGTPDKEEWLREAAAAYERVFGERDRRDQGHRPTTFSELEAEAVEEGNQLARRLLEGKISSQAEVSDCHGEQCSCPFCGKPAKRKREDLETREVLARPGAVSFKRYAYYCVRCRRSFFSAGPQSEPQG
jgi:hypothetical protein